ncbi:MAG: preprotein translocase subunit YajC [Planctomycetia bacterium]|nr:preprotein translocase subunit YajC [Planctomycetia bacterium]
MTPLSDTAWIILAEGAANPFSGVLFFWPFVLIVIFYIVLVHRPQRREQAHRQAMIANLKKNDHVLLTSGIYGIVANVRPDADEVTIKVDEATNAKLRITRSAIAKVITDEPAASADNKTN